MKTMATNALEEIVHETAASWLLLNISNKDEEGEGIFLTSAPILSQKPARYSVPCCDSIRLRPSMENVWLWLGRKGWEEVRNEKGLRVICHL